MGNTFYKNTPRKTIPKKATQQATSSIKADGSPLKVKPALRDNDNVFWVNLNIKIPASLL